MDILNLTTYLESTSAPPPRGTKLEDLIGTKFLQSNGFESQSATSSFSGNCDGRSVFKICLSGVQRALYKFPPEVRVESPANTRSYRFDTYFSRLKAKPSCTDVEIVGVLQIQELRLTRLHDVQESAYQVWKDEQQHNEARAPRSIFFIAVQQPGHEQLTFVLVDEKPSATHLWPYGFSLDVGPKVPDSINGNVSKAMYPLASDMPFAPRLEEISAHLPDELRKELLIRIRTLRDAFSSIDPVDLLTRPQLQCAYRVEGDTARQYPRFNGDLLRSFVREHTPALRTIAKDCGLVLLKGSAWWRQVALRYGCNFVLAVLVHFLFSHICSDNVPDNSGTENAATDSDERCQSDCLEAHQALRAHSFETASTFFEYAEAVRELFIHANDQLSRASSATDTATKISDSNKHFAPKGCECVPLEQAKLNATIAVLQQLCKDIRWKLVLWPVSSILSSVQSSQNPGRGFDVNFNWGKGKLKAHERPNPAEQSRLLLMLLDEEEMEINPPNGNKLSKFLAPYPLHTLNVTPGYRLLDEARQIQYEWRSSRSVKTPAVSVRDLVDDIPGEDMKNDFDPKLVETAPRDWHELEQLHLDDGSVIERYQKWAALFLAFEREARGTTLEAAAPQATSTPSPTERPALVNGSLDIVDGFNGELAMENDLSATAQELDVQNTPTSTGQPAVKEDLATSIAMLSADLADLTAIIIKLRQLNITMPLDELTAQLASPLLPAKLLNDLFSNPAFQWYRDGVSSSFQSVLYKPRPEYGLLDDETAIQNMEVGIRVDLAGLTKYVMKIRDLDDISDKERVSQQLCSMEIPDDLVARLLDNPELDDLWNDTTVGRGKKRKRTTEQGERGEMEDRDVTPEIKEEPEGDM